MKQCCSLPCDYAIGAVIALKNHADAGCAAATEQHDKKHPPYLFSPRTNLISRVQNMKRFVAAFACLFLFPLFSAAQATPGKPAFVSATVKPSVLPDPNPDDATVTANFKTGEMTDIKSGKIEVRSGHPLRARVDASQVKYNYLPLMDMIAIAYNVKLSQISGPGWLNDELFDIVATLPAGATKDEIPAMFQTLLQDRFKLAVHRETKNQPVVALVVAKGGPKLQPATDNPQPIGGNLHAPLPPINTPYGLVRILTDSHENCTLQSSKMSMTGLADLLTNLFQGAAGQQGVWQQVVDKTGLTGEYQVSFNTAMFFPRVRSRILGVSVDTGGNAPLYDPQNPNPTSAPSIPDPLDNPLDPIIFESIQKLGLKLELSKAPVAMLVVDHAEKNPTAN